MWPASFSVLIFISTSFQTVHPDIRKRPGKRRPLGILDVGTKTSITIHTWLLCSALLVWPHWDCACPGPPPGPFPTAWHRSSGPAAWPSSCRGAAGPSCSSTPAGTSPSQDIPIPRTSSSSWQIPQCPGPDYRIPPWLKEPRGVQRIVLWNAVSHSGNLHWVVG